MDIQTLTIPEATTHTHTIVFLHGRGDYALDFKSSFRYFCTSKGHTLMERFPSFRWVFPQAPTSLWTTSFGERRPQWFDVYNTRDFADHEELQAAGLNNSVSGIKKILAREATVLDGRWDRIILAGISQGAATALHTLLHLDLDLPDLGRQQKLDGTNNDRDAARDAISTARSEAPSQPRFAAFLGFSCRMPFTGRTLPAIKAVLDISSSPSPDSTQTLLRNTPILLQHCRDDQTVLLEHGRNLRDTLQQFGAGILEWREYPTGGHWFNWPSGADDLVAFLETHVVKFEGSVEGKETECGEAAVVIGNIDGGNHDLDMTDV